MTYQMRARGIQWHLACRVCAPPPLFCYRAHALLRRPHTFTNCTIFPKTMAIWSAIGDQDKLFTSAAAWYTKCGVSSLRMWPSSDRSSCLCWIASTCHNNAVASSAPDASTCDVGHHAAQFKVLPCASNSHTATVGMRVSRSITAVSFRPKQHIIVRMIRLQPMRNIGCPWRCS